MQMSVLLKPFLFIYQVFIYIPIMLVVTPITAVCTIALSYIYSRPELKTIPPRIWSKLACYLIFIRVKVIGAENLDKKKSYIFVANHQSIFDIWLIYGWLNKPFSWIIKKELRKVPLVGFACEMAGHIFIDRSHPIEARKSIAIAEQKLSNGNCVVVFPEGTRSTDGKVGVFKRGAFNIAADINLPVVPITIVGAYECMSRKSLVVKPGRITMIIHAPIENTSNLNEHETRELAKEVREIVVRGFNKQ